MEEGMVASFAGPTTGKREVDSWLRVEAEIELGGGGAVESLVRSVEGVVAKGELETAFESALDERGKGSDGHEPFECSPEPFDEGDGADFADGTEPVPDSEFLELVSKGLGGELAPLVGDEVAGSAVAANGFAQQSEEVFGGGFLSKDARRDGKPREGIEDECDLESEDPEETGNVGKVDEKHVIGMARRKSTQRWDGSRIFGWDTGGFFS
jgi:hypothetical protein